MPARLFLAFFMSAMVFQADGKAVQADEMPVAARTETLPAFEVDTTWPKVPDHWIFGVIAGLSVDAHDNVWVLHRPASVREKLVCCQPAPPVMEFDAEGKLLRSWGGPGAGFEWPSDLDEHGIFVDYKDNVWIGGRGANGKTENQILKFTTDGKFLLQIGHRGASSGSNDTANLGQPADFFVLPATNELFVADGYGNRRVIVFDATTGAYKRHWGAYGHRPDDAAPRTIVNEGPGDPQFNLVHSVTVSKDGLVYVADRLNRRVQIFQIDGTFVNEVFVNRSSKEVILGTAASVALSGDPGQDFMYVADIVDQKIVVFDRKSLHELARFGRLGRYPGEFVYPHTIAADSKGNLYVGEDVGGQRVQKFTLKGTAGSPLQQ